MEGTGLDIISVGEASRLLEVSDETVRKMEADGRLRPVHVTAAGWRFFERAAVQRLAGDRARALNERRIQRITRRLDSRRA